MRVVSLLSIIGVGSYWFVVELLALVDFLFLVSDLGGEPLVEDGFFTGGLVGLGWCGGGDHCILTLIFEDLCGGMVAWVGAPFRLVSN